MKSPSRNANRPPSINAKIAEVKTNRDHTLSDINQKRSSLEQGYDEAIAEKLDPVIKEGQKLEKLASRPNGRTCQEGQLSLN